MTYVEGTMSGFPISTTFEIAPYKIERTLGLCWGVIVRSVGTMKGLEVFARYARARYRNTPRSSIKLATLHWND